MINLNTPALTAYRISSGKFAYPRHISFIDKQLIDLVSGKSKRLIFNLPPRHGKSELISKYFPFWYLCNFPDNRIIFCSYEASFAQSWGRKVISLIDEFGNDLFGIKLKQNPQTAAYFEIENHNGSMTSVGAGGSITGRGADLIIIDDPVKNDEEANSITYREKLWDWFRSTVYTRLEPNGSIILIMTRWHEDDLCGRILNEFADSEEKWKLIKLPAFACDDDQLCRSVGEPLWSKRFNKRKLNDIAKSVGEYWFNALYQQTPQSAGGGIFKRKHFRYFEQTPGHFILFQGENEKIIELSTCKFWVTVDLAISLSTSADYTVLAVVAVTPNYEFIVVDIIRKRVEPSEHIELLKDVYSQYSPLLIGIESVQYQSALIKSAANIGLPVKELRPDADKFTRALPLAAKIETGTVYFKKDAVWLRDLESELLTFPKSKHDDQVDALSYLTKLVSFGSSNLPIGSKKL
jgi:predicted phage terminase large subunit-like protein